MPAVKEVKVTPIEVLRAKAAQYYPRSTIMQERFVEQRLRLESSGHYVLLKTSTVSVRGPQVLS